MKITTLLENTSARPELSAEHGLSLYIETAEHRILFDMGQTELFLENGDDLVEEIDEIVLHLNEYRDAISQKDGTRLYTLLDDGRRIKEALQ